MSEGAVASGRDHCAHANLSQRLSECRCRAKHDAGAGTGAGGRVDVVIHADGHGEV